MTLTLYYITLPYILPSVRRTYLAVTISVGIVGILGLVWATKKKKRLVNAEVASAIGAGCPPLGARTRGEPTSDDGGSLLDGEDMSIHTYQPA